MLLAITLILAGCAGGSAAICSGRVLARGGSAPPASGPAVSGGGDISLSDFAGKVVIVNFWASWCGPCRVETPMLVSAAADLTPTGVAFLGVDIRDDKASADAFQKEFGVSYRSIYDPQAAIAAAWGVVAPPSTYVIAPDGRIAATIPGPVDRADLNCMIATAGGPSR